MIDSVVRFLALGIALFTVDWVFIVDKGSPGLRFGLVTVDEGFCCWNVGG